MISRFALVIAAVSGICSAMPAAAGEIGIGVGPGGVTIGSGHGDRYRDRDATQKFTTGCCNQLAARPQAAAYFARRVVWSGLQPAWHFFILAERYDPPVWTEQF
jgi:hypothetical protein